MTIYRYSCGHSVNHGEGRETCPACEGGLLQDMHNFRVYFNRRKPGSGMVPPLDTVYTVMDSKGGHAAHRFPDRRNHPQLTNLIDDYLAKGWEITDRNPLTIRRGKAGWQLRNWCLSSL